MARTTTYHKTRALQIEIHVSGEIIAEEHEKEHSERFSIDSAVRGFHVYKDIWNPEIGEVFICEQEFGNLHDPYAVSVVH